MQVKQLQRFRFFIKLIGATLFLYACVNTYVKPVGEDTTERFFQEFLGNQNNFDTENSLQEEHFAAQSVTSGAFQKICDANITLCKLIKFIGQYNNAEKYFYFKNTEKTTAFVDKNNQIYPDFTTTIKNIDINNNEGLRRGYATRNNVVFNVGSVLSRTEFGELASHELGHIFDLGFLQGTENQKDQKFTEFKKSAFSIDDPSIYFYKISRNSETTRKNTSKKKDFCSGYGMSDPFEDFAECFNLYLNHNALFKYFAQNNKETLGKKYNFIATLFKGKYISSNTANLSGVNGNPNRRARDTTKISFY